MQLIGLIRGSYRIVLVAAVVAVFFVVYNTYLIDHSLESLRFTLEAVASADTIEGSRSLGVLLEGSLAREVTAKKVSTTELAQLEIVKRIVTKGEDDVQLKDARMLLGSIVEKKKEKRNKALLFLDAVNNAIKDSVKIARDKMISRLLRKPEMETIEAKELEALKKAEERERAWDLDKAIELYTKFIAKNPKYGGTNSVRLRLGYCYLKRARYESAEEACRAVINQSPGYMEEMAARRLLENINVMRRKAGEKDGLVAKANVTKDKKELQEIYYTIGALSTEVFSFKDAALAFNSVVELGPDTPIAVKAKFNLAWLDRFQNRLTESAERFNEIIREHPGAEEVINSKYELGNVLLDEGKYNEAAGMFEAVAQEAAEKDRSAAATIQFNAGYVYLHDLHDLEKARMAFERIKEYEAKGTVPEYVDTWILKRIRDLAFSHLARGEYVKSQEKFEEVLKSDPNDGVSYSGMAVAIAQQGRVDEALQMAKEGVARSPGDAYPHSALGFVYALKGEFENALHEFTEATKINKKSAVSYYNMGVIYEKMLLLDKAQESYEKAVEARPSFAEAHNNLAYTYFRKGIYEKSLNTFKTASVYRLEDAKIQYNIGLTLRFMGKAEEARAAFERALAIDPAMTDAKKNLQEIEIELKKKQEKGEEVKK